MATAAGPTDDFTHPDFVQPVESKFMPVEIEKETLYFSYGMGTFHPVDADSYPTTCTYSQSSNCRPPFCS
ncbi:hypothetical protein [Microcoleus sp. BROC3]|uniref:hypothetical protein n=1 Tax=Microcoleus sp. BROC3 TaxID=3055323 RepID=UPI002FD5CDC6